MAEALVSGLIEELASIAFERLEEEVRLVKDVEEDVRQLKSNLEAIQAVLEDAERRQLADQSVRNWLDKLKGVSFDIDNVLDEWSTAILKLKIEDGEGETAPIQNNEKVCFSIPSPFSCFKSKVNRITLRHDIAHKIKDLNQKLDRIAGEKDRFRLNMTTMEHPIERPKTTSFINEAEIYGRDNDKEILVSKLLSESSTDHQDKPFHIIPIVGMGGMGKTTLAQQVYNDEKVKTHFDKKIWVCVSDPFDEIKVAKAIVECIEGNAPNINELETLLRRIQECIEGKKFLLVLDDVWTEDTGKWEQLRQPFYNGVVGSRVLVTTRKQKVAAMMEAVNCMITLEGLSEEHCWSIFQRRAFSGREEKECKELEEIGQTIARKAKGSPLVAKTLGSLMYFKKTKTQWEDVLDNDVWQSKDVEKIFTPFLLSYYDLSAIEKRCFLYCSIFPKDNFFKRDCLIEMWMSQGYLHCNRHSEKEGYECFEALAMRSFFQDFEMHIYDGSIRHCKMHDIVHDFAQFLTKDECITMELDTIGEKYLNVLDEKTRHLTLVVGSDVQFPIVKHKKVDEKNIRTLYIVPNTGNNCSVHASLFSHLKFLRTLTMSKCGITKLPKSIGKLVHLRYLDLSVNEELEELPDSLCSLCNLETLNLAFCYSLGRLPEGMGRLINLKHLYVAACFQLEGLPRGIGTLTCLRRLDMLVIPKDKGAYFNMGDLVKLRNLQLRDHLHIKECRNIENAKEAEKLDLKNREKVFFLTLDFRGWSDLNLEEGNNELIEDDIALLEALEPHQNLAKLAIMNYMGASLSLRPRWLLSLINLRSLYLDGCQKCEIMPSFGELPSLEYLEINRMKSVKRVGLEFLGIKEKKDTEDDNATEREASSLNSPIISFPKLEELTFDSMEQWEKWEGTTFTSTEIPTSLKIMPCLKSLEFKKCPCLQELPDFLQTMSSLQYLSISESEILEEYCQQRTGKEWDKISHVPNIKLNGEFVRKDGIWIHEDDANDAIGTSSSAK